MKLPSIMYGAPKDDPAQAEMPENADRELFAAAKGNKPLSLGLRLGKSCFLGLKDVTVDMQSGRNAAGMAVPFDCGF